jgi:hypothetical protein
VLEPLRPCWGNSTFVRWWMALVGTPGGPVDTLQAIPVFDVAPPFHTIRWPCLTFWFPFSSSYRYSGMIALSTSP